MLTNQDLIFTISSGTNLFEVSADNITWGRSANLGTINALGTSLYIRQTTPVVSGTAYPPLVIGDFNEYSIIYDHYVGPVQTIVATVLGMTQIKLDWTPAFNAISYLVYYSSDSFGWTNVVTTSGLTYTFTGLGAGKSYNFKIVTRGERDEGQDSIQTITATTLAPQDQIAPETQIYGVPGTWATSATITLVATDAGGSGLDKTYYQIGSGATQIYTNPVLVTTQGSGVVFNYWSTDQQGNTEAQKTATLMIDSYGPVITPTVSDITGGKNVTATAIDTNSAILIDSFEFPLPN